jgi:preprotein translocase subunit Sec61beta
MVKRKRRKSSMPASGAGLVRYMEEEGRGIKFRPEHIFYTVGGLIILEILLKAGLI